MIVCRTIPEFRAARAGMTGPVGLVPTMGALHEGHISLVHRARADCATVTMSIFVNPAQFGPREDLSRYPRPIEADLQQAEAAGVDLVFHPFLEEMYAPGFSTYVEPGPPALLWEGERRPGHFRGVTTVVTKLFAITTPDRAYFGEKDYQQLQVVRRLVTDLNLPVDIVPCAIIREPDGLALSSRNVYLTPDERPYARALYTALRAGQERVRHGERDAERVRQAMEAIVADTPGVTVDYIGIVHPSTLEPVLRISSQTRALLAARLGTIRLIDNGSLLD